MLGMIAAGLTHGHPHALACAQAAAWLISHFFPWTTVPVYLWATLIGMSRLMLRVHFASDVIAGAILGTGMALLALRLVGS